MSYNITVGNNNDNIMRVGKTLTSGKVKSINPKEIQSIINPAFTIDYDSDLINANYVTTNFSNYQYFINDIIINTAGRMVLKCTLDPLSGFDFSKCPITVVRNGGIGRPTKIYDSKLPILPNEETVEQTVDENSNFDANGNYCYVLTVIGGNNVT